MVDSIGEALQCSLFEPIEFLQESCVQAARESVDSILKSHPLSSFVPERPYYQAPADNGTPGNGTGTGSGGLRGDSGDVQALVRVREGIALAVGAAQHWDSSKRVRGAMMLQHMLATAKTMAKEVTKQIILLACLLINSQESSKLVCCIVDTIFTVHTIYLNSFIFCCTSTSTEETRRFGSERPRVSRPST